MLRCPVPMVVTLHDLVPLKRRSEYLRTGLRFRLNYLAVQRAGRVIVPTEAVAVDARRELGLPEERIAVIHEAPAPAFRPRGAGRGGRRARAARPARRRICSGSAACGPRIRASGSRRWPAPERELPLVLVGPTSAWARELPGVIVTGTVDDEDLAAIYSGAHALVFPSDDEGFGLPPIEALACGTPVAACDVPALREVLGDRVALSEVGDLDGAGARGRGACAARRRRRRRGHGRTRPAAHGPCTGRRVTLPGAGPRRSGPRRRRSDPT